MDFSVQISRSSGRFQEHRQPVASTGEWGCSLAINWGEICVAVSIKSWFGKPS